MVIIVIILPRSSCPLLLPVFLPPRPTLSLSPLARARSVSLPVRRRARRNAVCSHTLVEIIIKIVLLLL